MRPESWFSFKSTGRLWAAMHVPGAHGLLQVEEIHSVDGRKVEGFSWAGARGHSTGEGKGMRRCPGF